MPFLMPELPGETSTLFNPAKPGTSAPAMPSFAVPNFSDMFDRGDTPPPSMMPNIPGMGVSSVPTPMGIPPGLPPASMDGDPGAGGGSDTTARILSFLMKAAPAIAMGFAARRGGMADMGHIAGGMADGIFQDRLADYRDESLTLQRDQLGETQRQRQAAAAAATRSAITGILDRARDDARNFEGSPEEFAKFRQQIREELEAYGAGDQVERILFPNAKFLKAVADEDRQWWDMVLKQHGPEGDGALLDPDKRTSVLRLTRQSAVRGGKSITLEDALRTIGLADEDGTITLPDEPLPEETMLPTGKRGESIYGRPERGKVYLDPDAPDKPDRPRLLPTQILKNEAGDLILVTMDENGNKTEIPLDVPDGYQRVGGESNAMEDLLKNLFGEGAAPGTTPADKDPFSSHW